MGEVFEDKTFMTHMVMQHGLAVVLVSTPENVVMRPGHHLDRVELNKAKALDKGVEIELAGGRLR